MGCDDWESTLVQLINNNSTPFHSSSVRHSNPANTIISDSGEPTQFPLHPSHSLALSSFAPSAAQTCIFTVDYNPNFLVLGWWWWSYFFLPLFLPTFHPTIHPLHPHITSSTVYVSNFRVPQLSPTNYCKYNPPARTGHVSLCLPSRSP